MIEARNSGRDRGLKTPLRVLVVGDSANDTALLLRELSRGGYETYFERVDTQSPWATPSVEGVGT